MNASYVSLLYLFHWNNPLLRSDFVDSSGMTLHYTANRRVHDANIMMIGQLDLTIPPGEAKYTVEGTCTQDCMSRRLSDTVYVTRALNHMHYMGRQQRIEHYRDGVKLQDLAYDELYSYDSPVLHEFQDPIELRPGDELKTTCTYRSVGKDRTTFLGDGTSDEMCFGFLTFHPAENIQLPYCLAWKGIDTCKLHSAKQDFPVIDGCNVHNMMNDTHPDTIRLGEEVLSRCKPFGPCMKECKAFVTEEQRRNKCLQGDVADYFRRSATDSFEYMKFWAALDSCKTEIAQDAFQCDALRCGNSSRVFDSVGGVGGVAASMFVMSFSLLVSLLMKL